MGVVYGDFIIMELIKICIGFAYIDTNEKGFKERINYLQGKAVELHELMKVCDFTYLKTNSVTEGLSNISEERSS